MADAIEMDNLIPGEDDDSNPLFLPPKDGDFYIDDNFDSDHLSLKGKKGAKKYQWKKYGYDSDDEEETSFGGVVDSSLDQEPLLGGDKKQRFNKFGEYRERLTRGWKKLKSYWPDVKYRNVDIEEADDGSLGVREKLTKKFTTVINSAGEIATQIPSRLRKFLGESFHTKLQRNARLNEEAKDKQHRLRGENIKDQAAYDKLHYKKTGNLNDKFIESKEGDEILNRMYGRNKEIFKLMGETDDRNLEDNNIIKKLPIRQRVKQIFKKYGLTVASILLAIWAVVATIIGTTQSVTVGDKKQEPGVVSIPSIRINKPIPIDPIITFIYDVALEVIEDFVENSFLLIELLVIFYIDRR